MAKSLSLCLLLAVFFVLYQGIISVNDVIVSDVQPEEQDTKNSDINLDFKTEDNNLKPFIPTNEWQVVKDNQAIPAGLHVRMNFQTGIKEAKLMDGAEQEQKQEGPKIVMGEDLLKDKEEFSKDKLYFTKSHLKEALREFRDKIGTKDIVDDVTWSDDASKAFSEQQNEDDGKVKKKFRSMEEIRHELEDQMGWKIKADVQVMKEHIEYLSNKTRTDEEKGAILDSLEDYVHQIDNARDLERVGGLEYIVGMLNDTNEVIQQKTANVIGAATQNNKVAQDAVLHHRGLPLLLRMLKQEKMSYTKKKGLFALSALLRGNSAAKKELVKYNGLKEVLDIAKDKTAGNLKVKAIVLLYDLIVDQNEAMLSLIEKGEKKSGDRPPLFSALIAHGWCDILVPLLETSDIDSKEKVIQALVISVDACKQKLHTEDVLDNLKKHLQSLGEQIKAEDDEDFKSYLTELYKQLEDKVLAKL